jgi:hypothetical protein
MKANSCRSYNGPWLFPSATCFSQHEVLKNKIPFATRKWSAAGSTGYIVVNRFRPAFHFDDLIQRLAVRTRKGNERRWPAHGTAPIPQSFLLNSTLKPQTRNCHLIVALTSQTSVVLLVHLPRLTAPRIWLGAFSLQCCGLKRRTHQQCDTGTSRRPLSIYQRTLTVVGNGDDRSTARIRGVFEKASGGSRGRNHPRRSR